MNLSVAYQKIASWPLFSRSFRLKCKPKTALYITRVNKNISLISFSVGTLPNSSRKAIAIFAFRSFFFFSGVGINQVYQNSLHMSSFDTLILRWDLRQHKRQSSERHFNLTYIRADCAI